MRQATLFQDLVIRCVRYAFAKFPAKIGRVFFSKNVALPFMRFRMIRHGYRQSPIPWSEVDFGNAQGIRISPFPNEEADVLIYYAHGGGFSMGSAYFYLEFLLAWVTLLQDAGYRNPTVLSLEYSLVPDASYPVQLEQAQSGYAYACSLIRDSSRICVGGDSAGATLILSLLLSLARLTNKIEAQKPGFATLISPWVTLSSPKNRNTPSDYLNSDSLHLYGRQYAGSEQRLSDPLVSPGMCKDGKRWAEAAPTAGFGMIFGSEEVLGPELRDLIALLRDAGCAVSVREEPGAVHAWPVVTLFLSDTQNERQKGVKDLVRMIRQAIPTQNTNGGAV